MAIPTITNNSPSAGRIAWGAFNIQLHGVTYAVGAGSTDQRWVWWKYNAGAPVITAGPDVPTTLVDDDLVLFANKNGIGVRVQSTNFVDGELLVDGSIFAEALSTNLINSQHIVTAGLDAGVIKFGTMSGDRIGVNTLAGDRVVANSIAVSKLMVADLTNFIYDPMFETPEAWSLSANTVFVGVTDGPAGNQTVIRSSPNNPLNYRAIAQTEWVTVTPGDIFRGGIKVRRVGATGTPVSVAWQIHQKNVDGTYSYPAFAAQRVVDVTWVDLVGDYTVPDNAREVQWRIVITNTDSAVYEFVYPGVRRKNGGELLVDGSITAEKIGSREITAEKIAADAITANELAADAVTADHLAVGSVTAESLAVGSVTATSLQASAVTADALAADAVTSTHLAGKFISGVTLDIEGSLYAEPGFLDVKADLMEAQSAIFHDNVTRRGTNNYIEGRETAASGVTNPGTPPAVTPYWSTQQMTYMYLGYTYELTNIVGACQGNGAEKTVITSSGNVVCVNPVTGAGRLIYDSGYFISAYGIARIGNWYYLLTSGFMSESYSITRISALAGNEGTIDEGWGMTAAGLYNTTANPQAIALGGVDDTEDPELWVLRIHPTEGDFYLRVLDPDTKTTLKGWERITAGPSPGTTESIAGFDPTKFVGTTMDVWLYSRNSMSFEISFLENEWAYVSAESGRTRPFGQTITAAMVDYSFDDTGRAYGHASGWDEVGASEFTYTWYDSDSGGLGVAESLESPVRSFKVPKGAAALVKTPLPPDDGSSDAPNTVRVYVGNRRSQGPDSPYPYELSAGELANGRVLKAPVADNRPEAPVVSGFASRPQTLPGGYKSTRGDSQGPFWWMYGDGEGRVGPIRWDNQGRFYYTTTLNATGAFAGYFTLTRVGTMIMYEGYIDRDDNFGTGRTVIPGVTLPTWARPDSNVVTGAQGGYGSTNQYRYIFNPDGSMEIQRTGTITTFMAMSGVYFVPPFA